MDSSREMPNLMYANTKGTDQPARRLVCAFEVHSLQNVIVKLARCKIQIFCLVSVAELSCSNHTWLQISKTGVVASRP